MGRRRRRDGVKHLFDAAEPSYVPFAVGESGGLRSQGGVKFPTGGNALSSLAQRRDEPAGAWLLAISGVRDEQTRCDPGADG
jgi:hypothetical protein